MEVQDEIPIGLNANHRTICKFPQSKENHGRFPTVSSPLKEMVATILKHDVKYSITSES
jgi:hypothetical protein